ncbi:MAG: hypothetical protein KJ904_13350 [Alphaproteobacteria bacterium]|nr:hypothetical protein [Alphaproteobacteria bacterium]MBU0798586.1 hypothetical protein [Alphaproteobacteria bacterium]MBU0888141.1 hypothetical protein [Alphaproteobacteria bacterium]MBU1811586.1 hypothetical protein [Alphaproteobacteria bacterium]
MMRYGNTLVLAGLACVMSLLAGDVSAQEKRIVTVENQSSTEVQVRMKLWQRDFTRIPVGRVMEFPIPSNYQTVQVEAKSRKQGDNCWSNVLVGGKLVLIDGNQQIVCQPR